MDIKPGRRSTITKGLLQSRPIYKMEEEEEEESKQTKSLKTSLQSAEPPITSWRHVMNRNAREYIIRV